MKSTTQTFNVSFPQTLVEQMDTVASEQFASRSDFLRTAALEYIRNEQEWRELFQYGKEIGSQAKPQSEEAVANELTAFRRQSGRWFAG